MGSSWFLLGDVNASRAKPDVEYGPESFFSLLIFYHHYSLGWPDKFVYHIAPGYAHLTAIKILNRDKFVAPR